MKKLLQCVLTLSLGFGVLTEFKAQVYSQLSKVVASDRTNGVYLGSAIAISGNYAIVGGYSEQKDENGLNSLLQAGAAYIYEQNLITGNWHEVQKVVGSDRETKAFFGRDVAISGEYAFSTAPENSFDENGANQLTDAGAVFVYKRDGFGFWNQHQKLVASDRASDDDFGISIDVSGDYLVVGARRDDHGSGKTDAGSVYIFKIDGAGMWNEVQKISASEKGQSHFFGHDVAISGDYITACAYRNDMDAAGGNPLTVAGAAFVFEKDGAGVWNEVQKVVASDRGADDNFAYRIDMDGEFLVCSGRYEEEDETGMNTLLNAGSAYIFERNGAGVWGEVQKIVPSDRAANDGFATDVAILGDQIVVGCHGDDEDGQVMNFVSGAGSLYLFEKNGAGGWVEEEKMVADDRVLSGNSSLGFSVAISEGYIIGGAFQNGYDTLGQNYRPSAGAGYIFSRISSYAVELECNSTSYTAPSGTVYTMGGIYLDTIPDHLGSDSILSIALTLGLPTTSTINPSACGYYNAPSGVIYTATGNYMDTISNTAGCDSIITINLTITGAGSDIDVKGNAVSITNNDVTPDLNDSTDFGGVFIGDSLDVTYTIENVGSCDLVLNGSVLISGMHASDFTVVTSPAGIVLPGNSTTVTLRFLPPSAGIRTATVTINSNDLDENPFVFDIQGNGIKKVSSPANDPCDGVLHFDGTNDFVDFGNVINPSNAITLEAWVKTDGLGARQTVINKAHSSLGSPWYQYNLEVRAGGQVYFALGLSSGANSIQTSATLTPGVWYHLAGTYDGSDMKVYIDDGVEVETKTATGTITPKISILTIGKYSLQTNIFNGSIDEARIWDVARSSADLNANLGVKLLGNESGLLGYWNFNNQEGSIAIDQTANGNDGTLTNMDTIFDWTHINGGFSCHLTPPNAMCETALIFNGNTGTVSVPHYGALKPTTEITIEAWLYPLDITTNTFTEIYRKEDGGDRHLFSFQGNGTILALGLNIGGSYSELDVSIDPADFENQWVHVAAVYDGVDVKIYRNGAQIGTQPNTGALGTSGSAIGYIGSSGGNNEYFNGRIDELRIWDIGKDVTALNASIHNQLVGNEPGLVAYFNFNDGLGSNVATNLVSGTQDGTLVGMNPLIDWVLPSGILGTSTGSISTSICNGQTYTSPSGLIYSTTGVYSDTIPAVLTCDSVITINLTVLSALTGSETSTICNGGSVTVNGTVYNASNPSGTEVFTNVGPSMCDSTVTVSLNVLPALTGSETSTICNGGSLTVNGTVYDASNPSGTEVFTNVGPSMCDSTVTVSLNILPALTGSETSTICNGGSVTVNGTVYDASNPSGTEVFTNVGPSMCDSTVTVNLNVLPALTGSVTNTICNGESLTVNGTVYDASNPSGTEVFTNVGLSMCDSTVTVNLNVLPALTGSVTNTICNGGSVTVNGTVYDASNPSGTEVFTNVGPSMCDSTVSVNLTVVSTLTGSVTNTICNGGSVTVNGTVYNASNPSGTELFTNVGPSMCDSLVTVNLTVVSTLTGSVTNTICNNDTIYVNGSAYHSGNPSGTELFTNVGPSMCDSTVTINLTVLPVIDTAVTVVNDTLTVAESGATYQWLDCNNGNSPIAGATSQQYITPTSGSYAVEVTVGGCVETSGCNTVTITGVDNYEPSVTNYQLFPNPTSGVFTVSISDLKEGARIIVYSVLGKEIINENLLSSTTIVNLKGSERGVYFVKIQNGKRIITKRIIKN